MIIVLKMIKRGNTWWSLKLLTESVISPVDSQSIRNPIASNAIMVSVLKNPCILCFLYTIFSMIWITGCWFICGGVNSGIDCFCGGGVYVATCSFSSDVGEFVSGSNFFPLSRRTPNVFSTKFVASTILNCSE